MLELEKCIGTAIPRYNLKPTLRAFKKEVKLYLAQDLEECLTPEIPFYNLSPTHRTFKKHFRRGRVPHVPFTKLQCNFVWTRHAVSLRKLWNMLYSQDGAKRYPALESEKCTVTEIPTYNSKPTYVTFKKTFKKPQKQVKLPASAVKLIILDCS